MDKLLLWITHCKEKKICASFTFYHRKKLKFLTWHHTSCNVATEHAHIVMSVLTPCIMQPYVTIVKKVLKEYSKKDIQLDLYPKAVQIITLLKMQILYCVRRTFLLLVLKEKSFSFTFYDNSSRHCDFIDVVSTHTVCFNLPSDLRHCVNWCTVREHWTFSQSCPVTIQLNKV